MWCKALWPVLVSVLLVVITVTSTQADCPLQDIHYEDADKRGFRMAFAPTSGIDATEVARAVIWHPKRGVMFEFSMYSSMGSGQLFFRTREGERSEAFRVHFFGNDLQSWSFDRGDMAAPYLLIEGLGHRDHYGWAERPRHLVGTPMWRRLPCQSAAAEPDEWSSHDGLIVAHGVIRDLGTRDGQGFLHLDDVERVSREECSERAKAGTAPWTLDDCKTGGFLYDNARPTVREFGVSDRVQIIVEHPTRPGEALSWNALEELWGARAEDTAELWDGLWRVYRREEAMEDVVERLEWFHTP